MNFHHKSALIVGASRGVGRQLSLRLSEISARTVAVARNASDLDTLKQLDPSIETIAADASAEGTAAKLITQFSPDLLVLAGGSQPKMLPISQLSWSQFSTPWNTDTKIAFEFTKAALLAPLADGSAIVSFATFCRLVVPSLSFKLEQMIEALTSHHKKESAIMTRERRFVGLDVGKFEIYAFDAADGRHLMVENSADGHADLVLWLRNPTNTIIALEPTGGYEWLLWETLCTSGYDARQVCAAHVRAFARATGTLVKTDPIVPRLIARFIAFRPDPGRRPPVEKIRKLRL